MPEIVDALRLALHLIAQGDGDLVEIVLLSLKVSLSAVLLAALLALPFGGFLATSRFAGRSFVIGLVNAFMGMPPVVAGLLVYLLLSRAGPLGVFGLLYSPQAMTLVQILLVFPIVAALSCQSLGQLEEDYRDQLTILGLSPLGRLQTLLHDGRYHLITALLAGFGRAIAEVGGVMIVGGNIDHVTRVMTTAIALETSKGNLALALALGIVLVLLAVSVNLLVMGFGAMARRAAYQ